MGQLHQFDLPTHLSCKGSHLALDGHDLVKLCEAHGSPLFVYSERRLMANAKNFLTAARAGHARSSVFFASKACSNLHVLRAMKRSGLGIEVNSGGELWKARSVGFTPDRIVFNGVAKTLAELHEAISRSIRSINVESAFELQRIADVASALGVRASVALRAVPGIGGGANAGIQTGNATSKFGMTEPELRAAVAIAVANRDCLNIAGIHVHIGSQVADIADFTAGVEFVSRLNRDLSHLLGSPLRHFNLGGGYPVDYAHLRAGSNQGTVAQLQAFATPSPAAAMVRQVAALAARKLGPDAEVFFEPGRSIVADTAVLIGRIENTRMRGDMSWLYLDAGYNLLIDSAAVRWYYHMTNASRMDEVADAAYRMVGPLCDSADCFFDVDGEHLWASLRGKLGSLPPEALASLQREIIRLPETRSLPANTTPGDFVALLDTGAYSLGEMFQYCGRQRAKAIMIRANDEITVLRERDQPEDLIDRAELSALKDSQCEVLLM